MNLLPDSRKQQLTRFYFVRVGVVCALMLAGVFLVHTILTVPTYLHLAQNAADSAVELAALTERIADSKEQEIGSRVASLSERTSYLATATRGATASGALRAFVAMPHKGVRITSFAFVEGVQARLSITGGAASRETLRAYAGALTILPY
ncbi:MAG: hypothetical protein AAB737_04355, partial [Patescibacteria group bacterium]